MTMALICCDTCETLPVNCFVIPRNDATTAIFSGAIMLPVSNRFWNDRFGTLPPEQIRSPPRKAVSTYRILPMLPMMGMKMFA